MSTKNRNRRFRKSKAAKGSSAEKVATALTGLDANIFADLKMHGNTRWQPRILSLLAILWALELQHEPLTIRWKSATNILRGWFPRAFVGTSYQGFIQALARWSSELLLVITTRLRALTMDVAGANHWKIAGRPVFALDGTKVAVPWSDDTDQKLGNQTLSPQARRRRQKQAWKRSANSKAHLEIRPQILLTLAWHVGTGLPWAWKTGPVTASEREHARELVKLLPPRSLAVEDAGFTGYDFWKETIETGHDFVTRIGANVTLLKKLGWKVRTSGEHACLWPADQQRKKNPPIVVRLVCFQTKRSTIWLATTVLSQHALSDRQLAEIYGQRWGIEGWFRGLKQTFGRRKLHSRTAEHALCELQWSIVGLALIQYHGVKALVEQGDDPQELSETAAIRAVRSTVLHADFRWRNWTVLTNRLETAILDNYVRIASKQGHHIHRQRTTKPTGNPQFINATKQQIRDAQQLQTSKRAA